MEEVIAHLQQAAAALADIAEAQENGVNTEEFARQVDAEYGRVAVHLENLAGHLLDLHTNPRPAPETYSAKL